MIMIYTNEYGVYLEEEKIFYLGVYNKEAVGRLPQYLEIQYFIRKQDWVTDKYFGDYYQFAIDEETPDNDDFRETVADNLGYVYGQLNNIKKVDPQDPKYEDFIEKHYREKEYGIQESSSDELPPLSGYDVGHLNRSTFTTPNKMRAGISCPYVITFNQAQDTFMCNTKLTNALNHSGYPDDYQAIPDHRDRIFDNQFFTFKQSANGKIDVLTLYSRVRTYSEYRKILKDYIDNYTGELYAYGDAEDKFNFWEADEFQDSIMNDCPFVKYDFLTWFRKERPKEKIQSLKYDRDDMEEAFLDYHTSFDIKLLGLVEYGLGLFVYIDKMFKEQGGNSEVLTPLGLVKAYEYEPDDPFTKGNNYILIPDETIVIEEDIINLDLANEEYTPLNDNLLKYTEDDFNFIDKEKILNKSEYSVSLDSLKETPEELNATEQLIVEEDSVFRKDTEYLISKEGVFVKGREDLVQMKYRQDEYLAGFDDDGMDWYRYYYPSELSTQDLSNATYLSNDDFE